jgi:hypothetical protein
MWRPRHLVSCDLLTTPQLMLLFKLLLIKYYNNYRVSYYRILHISYLKSLVSYKMISILSGWCLVGLLFCLFVARICFFVYLLIIQLHVITNIDFWFLLLDYFYYLSALFCSVTILRPAGSQYPKNLHHVTRGHGTHHYYISRW